MLAGGVVISIGSQLVNVSANWLMLTAFGLLIVSAYVYRPVNPESALPLAAGLMLAGWILMGVGHHRASSKVEKLFTAKTDEHQSVNRRAIFVGVVLLTLLAIANGREPFRALRAVIETPRHPWRSVRQAID